MLWSPCCPRDSQESSPAPQFKGINSLVLCLLYGPALPTVHDHHSFDYTDLCQQNAVSVFNILSRFVIAFLPRSKRLLISWLQLPPRVILEPKKRKSVSTSTFSPSICHEVMGPDAMILVFLIFSFKPALSLFYWVISLSNDGGWDQGQEQRVGLWQDHWWCMCNSWEEARMWGLREG